MALRKEGFWDEHYGLELKNYEEDGDEGEVWFGKGLSRKIVLWLLEKLCATNQLPSRILDIGCGNAFTLCTLVDKFKLKFGSDKVEKLKILGIDYSSNSIDLSKKIVEARGFGDNISLEKCNFLDLKQLQSISQGEKFDFVIDIGTYDAICLLSGDSRDSLEKTKLKYAESLYSLVETGSIFILASCNHTEDELIPLFHLKGSHRKFEAKLIDRIETPKMQFGGKEGSQVTCLILQFSEPQ